jgi:hypothetical protein
MNASDITKAKQSRTLYQAYYRPTIFSTLFNSSIEYCPISTISTTSGIDTSVISCVSLHYSYRCTPPVISYELANSVNNGRYLCGFPFCSSISEWNTGATFNTASCDCKISLLTWKNTNVTPITSYSTSTYSTVVSTTTNILTGPGPIICPLVEFYQGTNFDNRCNSCNYLISNNACCENCSSG